MLRPDRTVQKLLISSTSRFVGEYESESLFITHAWQHGMLNGSTGMSENPYCRNYYVAVFKTSPIEKKAGVVIPDYAYVGELLCIYLSILFGKRFDNHGVMEGSGHFSLPNLGTNRPIALSRIGSNNHLPRKDLGIELNLDKVKLIEKILHTEEVAEDVKNIIISAGRFYLRSLRIFEEEPELAFLDLITCGEILSNYHQYSDEELFDEKLITIFKQIESKIDRGESVSSNLKQRLFQVKRKYTLTICNLLNDYFFTNSESTESFTSLSHDNIEQRVKASYDLRSLYVHTGVSFGSWLFPNFSMEEEIHIGTPVGLTPELTKLIVRTPTFVGMERIMRFCLLRFIHLYSGITIDSRLD